MAVIMHREPQAADSPASRAVPPARPRVLVAEDHADTLLMIRMLLEKSGYDVLEATNGEEAVAVIEGTRPDLVLIDGELPRLDGVTVTRRVRERESAAPRVPIIFLSGRAEPVARRAALDAGCDDYLVKPEGIFGLASTVAKHLQACGKA